MHNPITKHNNRIRAYVIYINKKVSYVGHSQREETE